jgi:hypothetical protein
MQKSSRFKKKQMNDAINKVSSFRLLMSEEDMKQHPVESTKLMQHCIVVHEPSVSGTVVHFSDIQNVLNDILNEEIKRCKNRSKLVPYGFLCPITQDVMKDSVMLIDGHSYERKAIVDWL